MSQHRKLVKHYHEPGDLHAFTFSCYRRLPLLTNDVWRASLAGHLTTALAAQRFQLVAFVFMPEHVHLLTLPLDPQPAISEFLRQIKQPYSSEIHERLRSTQAPLLARLTIRDRPGKQVFRYWQEGPGFDRNLNTPQAVQAEIDYLHNNPVARKLCRRAIDWKWSSARHYLLQNAPRDPELPPLSMLPAHFWDGSEAARRFD
jgi:putative transposase